MKINNIFNHTKYLITAKSRSKFLMLIIVTGLTNMLSACDANSAGAVTTVALVAYAVREGWIDPDEALDALGDIDTNETNTGSNFNAGGDNNSTTNSNSGGVITVYNFCDTAVDVSAPNLGISKVIGTGNTDFTGTISCPIAGNPVAISVIFRNSGETSNTNVTCGSDLDLCL